MRRSIAAVVATALVVGACGGAAPAASPAASAAAAATSIPTPTASPTPTPSPVPTAAPTAKPTAAPTSTPFPTSPTGVALVPGGQTGRVVTPDQVYAVTLPDPWQTVPLTAGDLGPIASIAPAGTISDAVLAAWQKAIAANGANLIAADVSALAEDGSIVAVTVTRSPVGTAVTLDAMSKQIEAALPTSAGIKGSFTRTRLALPMGPTDRFIWRSTYKSAVLGPNTDVVNVVYVAIQSPYAYSFSFTAPYSERSTVEPVFEKMMGTVTIL